ncbi:MAG: 30S ribosomal protein S6 [Planctomycetes bacterium]|nr:30S ribosomal protein S6 [Planctomycetota bacterium]
MTTVVPPGGAPAGAPSPSTSTATAPAPAATTTAATAPAAPAVPAAPVNTNTTRLYEGMFLVDPIAAAKEWEKVSATLTALITKYKGVVRTVAKWTERKLAYAIRRQRRGTYVLVYFVAPMDAVTKMRRDVAINEQILRAIFIAHPEAMDVPGVPPPPPPLKDAEEIRLSDRGRPPRRNF